MVVVLTELLAQGGVLTDQMQACVKICAVDEVFLQSGFVSDLIFSPIVSLSFTNGKAQD